MFLRDRFDYGMILNLPMSFERPSSGRSPGDLAFITGMAMPLFEMLLIFTRE